MKHFHTWAANHPDFEVDVRDGIANIMANSGRGVGVWCPCDTLQDISSVLWGALNSDASALPTPAQHAAQAERANSAAAAVFCAMVCTAALAKNNLQQQVPALESILSNLEDAVSYAFYASRLYTALCVLCCFAPCLGLGCSTKIAVPRVACSRTHRSCTASCTGTWLKAAFTWQLWALLLRSCGGTQIQTRGPGPG